MKSAMVQVEISDRYTRLTVRRPLGGRKVRVERWADGPEPRWTLYDHDGGIAGYSDTMAAALRWVVAGELPT